jgi:hypothetical protein
MRLGSRLRAPSREGNADERPAAGSLLCEANHQAAPMRIPWLRRRPPRGCLFDPGGPCVLSALLVSAGARPTLDELVAALAAEADARVEAALRERFVSDDRLSQALMMRRTLEQWITRATHRRRRRALAGVAVTFASSAYTVPLCLLADAPVRLTVGVAMAVLTTGSALSLLALLRRTQTGWPLPLLITGLLWGTGVGMLLIVEGAIGRAIVGDEVATLIGLAAASASLLIQAVVTRLGD